jgi:3,4-dihydroxy 2-butanone 4-phosphate synthase/GTP cyclohydrolase II
VIERALDDVRAGRPIVVAGDTAGHVVVAAERVTPDAVNFMARHARGLICLALTSERCDELGLELMAARGTSSERAPFTVSIEARNGITTGISAYDRARTVSVAIDPATRMRDIVQPGHVFPLRARPGGLLEHAGNAEMGVDLARMAGLRPGAAICAVMGEDGALASPADLAAYCERHGLAQVTVGDLIDHRLRTEPVLERLTSTRMSTPFGDFDAVGFRSVGDGREHVAVVKGDVAGAADVLVCLHAECVARDVFGALGCGCDRRVDDALERIEQEGRGVLLYIAREARGMHAGDDPRRVTGPREDAVGAQMLAVLGPRSVRVLGDDEVEGRLCSAPAGLTRGER